MVVAAALCTSLGACYVDHRKDLAYDMLYDARGWPVAEAMSGALAARFPAGSPVEAVQSFASAHGGTCSKRSGDVLWCEWVTHAKYCAASMVGVEVSVRDAKVQSLKVKAGGLSC